MVKINIITDVKDLYLKEFEEKDITKTARSINDLNMAIKDFENSSYEIAQEKSSLKYQLAVKN